MDPNPCVSVDDPRLATIDVHETGLVLAERYGLSVYDAMIVASAMHAGCDTLWSDDMQDGLVLEGRLRIIRSVSCSLRRGRFSSRLASARS
jgi:predicted nucleic acid-binding protein